MKTSRSLTDKSFSAPLNPLSESRTGKSVTVSIPTMEGPERKRSRQEHQKGRCTTLCVQISSSQFLVPTWHKAIISNQASGEKHLMNIKKEFLVNQQFLLFAERVRRLCLECGLAGIKEPTAV